MGSLFKSTTKTTQQPFESNPWKPQQDYLKTGFKDASGALSSGLQTVGNISDFTADMTPDQIADLERIRAQGGSVGDLSQAAIGAGQNGINNFNQFGANAGNLVSQAGVDPTQRILSNAQAYMNDPNLQGQIDAALGDVNKSFQRQVGDINSGATGTGNINSTRSGTLEAYALDDAMDRGAQISSGMRGAAYQSGLDRATTTDANRFQQQLTANQQLGAAGEGGFNIGGAGYGLGAQGAQDSLMASSAWQQQAQAEIQGQIAQGKAPMDLIQQYMATIGGNYGQNGYQTQVTEKPSIFQTLVGGAATAAGMGWKPF
jgi:hypothetical protein